MSGIWIRTVFGCLVFRYPPCYFSNIWMATTSTVAKCSFFGPVFRWISGARHSDLNFFPLKFAEQCVENQEDLRLLECKSCQFTASATSFRDFTKHMADNHELSGTPENNLVSFFLTFGPTYVNMFWPPSMVYISINITHIVMHIHDLL